MTEVQELKVDEGDKPRSSLEVFGAAHALKQVE